MTKREELGKLGEDLACRYLVDKGYKIIERNFRKPWGELDIIAKSPDKTLVFVEVKTVRQSGKQSGNSSNSYPQLPGLQMVQNDFDDSQVITAEMQMSSAKIRKTKNAASLYAGSFPELVNDKKGWRIDLLSLTLKSDSGSNMKDFIIRHYENI